MLTHSLLESTILLLFKLSPSQQTLILTQRTEFLMLIIHYRNQSLITTLVILQTLFNTIMVKNLTLNLVPFWT